MRRATRQFRWTKILSASCVNDYYFYVTSNCMRRATRQFETQIIYANFSSITRGFNCEEYKFIIERFLIERQK